jgi:uncharacterized membrane protein YkoI
MWIRRVVVALSLLGAAVTVALPAGAGTPQHEAKVPIETARAKALSVVAGSVVAEELEHEGGRWIYSFEIKPKGETRKIVKEVNIDADTGALVSVELEKE